MRTFCVQLAPKVGIFNMSSCLSVMLICPRPMHFQAGFSIPRVDNGLTMGSTSYGRWIYKTKGLPWGEGRGLTAPFGDSLSSLLGRHWSVEV